METQEVPPVRLGSFGQSADRPIAICLCLLQVCCWLERTRTLLVPLSLTTSANPSLLPPPLRTRSPRPAQSWYFYYFGTSVSRGPSHNPPGRETTQIRLAGGAGPLSRVSAPYLARMRPQLQVPPRYLKVTGSLGANQWPPPQTVRCP
jgi:hypothetical protein